jgi:hypothetical protein
MKTKLHTLKNHITTSTRSRPLDGTIVGHGLHRSPRRKAIGLPRLGSWLAAVGTAAALGGLGTGSAEASAEAINFDSQYNPNFNGALDYGVPFNASPITGTLGLGAANQANWNNLHSQQCVNSYLTGNINANILDSHLANPIALHVPFPDQYGNAYGPLTMNRISKPRLAGLTRPVTGRTSLS